MEKGNPEERPVWMGVGGSGCGNGWQTLMGCRWLPQQVAGGERCAAVLMQMLNQNLKIGSEA